MKFKFYNDDCGKDDEMSDEITDNRDQIVDNSDERKEMSEKC